MAAINDHTRKQIQTGIPSKEYKDGWDRVFGKNKRGVSLIAKPVMKLGPIEKRRRENSGQCIQCTQCVCDECGPSGPSKVSKQKVDKDGTKAKRCKECPCHWCEFERQKVVTDSEGDVGC